MRALVCASPIHRVAIQRPPAAHRHPHTSNSRSKGSVTPLRELQGAAQAASCPVQARGRFLRLEGDTALLSRIISPVRATNTTHTACGYTLVSVKRKRTRDNKDRASNYVVVGAHTCGRSVPVPGQRCKQHVGTAQFEVWRVRQVAAEGEGVTEQHTGKQAEQPRAHQAMLLSTCQSVQQLERLFGLRHQLQVRVCRSV